MPKTREYAWKNITVNYKVGKNDDVQVFTLQEVSYSSQMELGALYGEGDEPRSIQQGNRSYEGQIAMLQSEYEKLRTATSDFDFNFNITVKYILNYKDTDGTERKKVNTHTLTNCQCAGAEYSMSQGELGQILTVPFMFTDVNYGKTTITPAPTT